MNETIKTILRRRSCRAFEDKAIAQRDLEQIMQAAVCAPSGRNGQKWQFVVLNDRKRIQTLAAAMGEALEREHYDMYSPQVLVIVSTPKDWPYGIEDNACALENIFLAATSLGIGSCWINQIRDIADDPKIRELLTGFGVPAEHTVYGMAALGYPKPGEIKSIERTGKIIYVD